MASPYPVAGIDVHKNMLAVVVTDAAQEGPFSFERRKFGTLASELRALEAWLTEKGVREVIMESTAQYWKPVWRQLESRFQLHLAQAHSNRAPRGRKRDFRDAERLTRRYIAGELILSFVPDAEQRLWRTITRTKQQLTRDRVRLHNQLEAFLEETRIKLASCVSDLLGVSSRRMLKALAQGETDPEQLAKLADPSLRAEPAQLADALSSAPTLSDLQRGILSLFLDRLDLMERQIEQLDCHLAAALETHHEAILRLIQIPGYGVDSAQQVIAEVGPQAAVFPSPEQLASWVGTCPGREESAEVSKSDASPKGNRQLRRVLTQVAHAAVKTKGCFFQGLYRRLVPRLGHQKAIWAVAHRLCRLTWRILHEGVRYEERGQVAPANVLRRRVNRLLRQLRALGQNVQLTPAPQPPIA